MLRVFIALLLIEVATCLMCYQCADSSAEKGRNDCQAWVRTQRYYRRRFEQKGVWGKYMKNCTGFAEKTSLPTYCMIASVELGGGVRSFIRDCSDGQDFFGADYNDLFKDNILPDNQTTCLYTGQGYLACVTLCGPDHGNFCNGPLSKAVATEGCRTMLISLLAGLIGTYFLRIL